MSGKSEKKFSWEPPSWVLFGCATVLANDGHVVLAAIAVAVAVGYAMLRGAGKSTAAAQSSPAAIEVAASAYSADAGMLPSGPSSAEVMRTWLVLF